MILALVILAVGEIVLTVFLVRTMRELDASMKALRDARTDLSAVVHVLQQQAFRQQERTG